MNDMASDRLPVRLGSTEGARNGLPLVVTPGEITGAAQLADWLGANRPWLQAHLRSHGALLFRGFGVQSPQAFERLARSVDDDLKNEYLGTSPRDALTDYVFSASELPGYYPIPEHCEMTFTAHPPRRIFFWCSVEPKAPGGETPLVDFAAVWRDLDPEVKRRFEERGLTIIRNYSGPGTRSRDLFQLKRWDEMFRTTDKGKVEEMAKREGFEPQWHENDRLTLLSHHAPTRAHPETGEAVWFNHSQVFHLSAAPGEFRRIFGLRPSLRGLALWAFSTALVAWKRMRLPSGAQAMHCTFGDGSEIPDRDMERVRNAIWRNMAICAWKQGDVVAIDNNRVGHGRLPYRGPRMVAVCWA